ncbi:hypothetical protein DL93DRAFT_2072153 [Clavulina sp. PMI_390]|nr:hypothetical protein DL93DRAFT_2072153 [Clavulina sp. PMI_390]
MEATQHSENSTITFRWTLKGLRNLFDSSKGDVKSKPCKSINFGGGQWQILFYANSGQEGDYVSLYLACQPTEDEQERAVDANWVREGLFTFSLEIRDVADGVLSPQKVGTSHSFSHQTQNWGWAKFEKRDLVFYDSDIVREADAFQIICCITSVPVS